MLRGRSAGGCFVAAALALMMSLGTSVQAVEATRYAQVYLEDWGDEEIDDHDALDLDPLDETDRFLRPDAKKGDETSEPPQSTQESKQDRLERRFGEAPSVAPLERPKLLARLYAELAAARNAEAATPIMLAIEEVWRVTGSDTVDLLVARAELFAKAAELDLALQILDATTDIAPEEAEVWHQRAKVYALREDYGQAFADLRRALSLDPKHYRAMNNLGIVLEELGAKKEALQAYREALQLNPFLEDTQARVEALSREVEGQDI